MVVTFFVHSPDFAEMTTRTGATGANLQSSQQPQPQQQVLAAAAVEQQQPAAAAAAAYGKGHVVDSAQIAATAASVCPGWTIPPESEALIQKCVLRASPKPPNREDSTRLKYNTY